MRREGGTRIYDLVSSFWCMLSLIVALQTPLFFAAVNGHVDCMALLLDHGADIHARELGQGTALHTVARKNYVECARLLIGMRTYRCPCPDTRQARGCQLEARDSLGMTPLHHAASEGSLATLQLLLDSGADANARDGEGDTPLHWAIRCCL